MGGIPRDAVAVGAVVDCFLGIGVLTLERRIAGPELVKVAGKKPGTRYPRLINSSGDAPEQYPDRD